MAGLLTAGTNKQTSYGIYCMSLFGTGTLQIQNLSRVFLKPKDLYTLRANGLIDPVANTRLGIAH